MKITSSYALLAAISVAFATTAVLATDPGPYIGVGIGVHMPRDSGAMAQIPTGSPATNFNTDFDTGVIGIGSFGYKWDKGFRTELELGYRQADISTVHGISALGVQRDLGFSANVLYDFDTNSALKPYIGGGLGVSSNKWHHVITTGSPDFTDSTAALQWQGIAGVSLKVSDRVELFADYRYIGAGKNQFESEPSGSLVTNHSDRSNNVLIGLRFALNSPKPMPAAEAPRSSPPPPPPPPLPTQPAAMAPAPAVPQKFLVFFDFDKAILRSDARQTVSEAAEYAKSHGKAVITATGHTDTSGTADYNMGLSERRAEAVAAALAKLGFSDKEIVVRWKGKSEPLVVTGDGVKEPQNRRVEIVLE